MHAFTRLRSLQCTILAVTALHCQSVSAQPAMYPNPLAGYVPEQDQLCNYCQDYSAGTVPAGHLATLYQPGIGYSNPLAGTQLPDRKLALGSAGMKASPPDAPTN